MSERHHAPAHNTHESAPELSRQEAEEKVDSYRDQLAKLDASIAKQGATSHSADEYEAWKNTLTGLNKERTELREEFATFVGPEMAEAFRAIDWFDEEERQEPAADASANKKKVYENYQKAEENLADAKAAFYGQFKEAAGDQPATAKEKADQPVGDEESGKEKETTLEGDAKKVEEALTFFEVGTPIDPEKLQAVLVGALGETVTKSLSDRMRNRLATEVKCQEVLLDFLQTGKAAQIEGNQANIDRFTGIFAADDMKAGLDDKNLPAVRTQGGELVPVSADPTNPDAAGAGERVLTPEQKERAGKLNAAADKLARLKAQPFYKRNREAIEAAKAEYDEIAQEVGRELVAEAPDEPSRQAQFAAAQVGMWRDINSRVADLRKDTKYGRIVAKIGKMHPAARMAIMAGAGVATGVVAATVGAAAGGGLAVAAGVSATVFMTKAARAKLSLDASMSEANKLRTKGGFDKLIAKFGEVSGLSRLTARGERKLSAKYESKADELKAAIEEQAARESWSDDKLIAKLARVEAGKETHMDAARYRRSLAVGLVALGVGAGAHIATEAGLQHIGLGTHDSASTAQKPTNGSPADKPAGGNKLSPIDAFNLSHKTEMDFLNSNGRVHNDFNNIPVDSPNSPEHANLFHGYDALQNEYQKSPMELSAQLEQIQEIEMASNRHFDALPQNLQLQPGENPDAYAARLSDAIHHDQGLHDKLTAATMDYLRVHGQAPELINQSYHSWWIGKDGIAHWESTPVWSNDPNDVIIRLSDTKGIRLPCGQPIELIPQQHHIAPVIQTAVYQKTPETIAPTPAPEAPAPVTPAVVIPPVIPVIPSQPLPPPVIPWSPIPTGGLDHKNPPIGILGMVGQGRDNFETNGPAAVATHQGAETSNGTIPANQASTTLRAPGGNAGQHTVAPSKVAGHQAASGHAH